jgi:hypothetical protein
MTREERINNIKRALGILKDNGVMAMALSDDFHMKLIFEGIRIEYIDDVFKIFIDDEGDRIDITDYVTVKSMGFFQGFPSVTLKMFPKKLKISAENVKIKKGE